MSNDSDFSRQVAFLQLNNRNKIFFRSNVFFQTLNNKYKNVCDIKKKTHSLLSLGKASLRQLQAREDALHTQREVELRTDLSA